MPETAFLTDSRSPLRIEYSRPVMERIRAQACDGLMALPRIGMGVGGLLLGVREDGLVRLLDSIEIHCSHASGPSFLLNAEEKDRARELIAGAGVPGVIGWYCSKTRATPALGDADLAFFREFFPGREQVALVLRPSTVEPTHASFFYRNEKGEVVKGLECEVDEWHPEPVALEPEAAANAEPEASAEPAVAEALAVPAQPVEPVAEPVPFAIESIQISEPEPAPLPRKATPAPPVRPIVHPDMFAFATPPPPRSKRIVWLIAPLFLIVAAAAAWFTQASWIPRPPLSLTSAESDGSVAIRWNTDAFRGLNKAWLYVNEDGSLQTVPLDRFQLSQGVYRYTHRPNAQRVTARLAAGENGAIAVWLAPPPPAPAPPAPAVATGTPGTGGTTDAPLIAPPPVFEKRKAAPPAKTVRK